MNFPEAVEFLARRANIPLPELTAPARPGAVSSDQKDTLLKVNRATAVYFHHNLKAQVPDSPVRKYLAKRGLTDEIVDTFRLGYSTDEWQGLGRHLVAKGVKIDSLEKLQLIKPKKTPGPAQGIDRYFDLFRDRLMFPIFAPNGDTLGFGGRVLDDTLPKYVNSADSPVFHKSKVLYGLHETGKFIRAQDEVIVVEGYMDAIALYVAGFKNVVAILGTAMTPDHAKLLKRYTSNVKMLLDGDEAGINAAEKSLPILLGAGLMAKGLILPEKLDPDEFVKERGADALRTELDRAPELFNVLLTKRWLANYHGSDSEKVLVVNEAAVALGPMANKSLMELYLLELSRQLDIDVGWVRRAVAQAVQALAPRIARPAGSGPQTGGPSRPDGAAPQTGRPNLGGSSGGPNSARPQSGPVSGRPAQGDSPPDFDFAPPDAGFAPAEDDDSLTAELPPAVSLKGAPKDEAFVMSLLLYNEGLLRDLIEAGPDEILKMMSHPGVRETLKKAISQYQADPGSFQKIAPNLASEVDQPALLASSLPLTANLTDENADKKLMADYLNAIRRRYMKAQGKNLVTQLRERPTAEMMEQVQALQRNRLGKDET
jgi:DNA primase